MNVFIHGYGTNIASPFQKPLGKNKNFTVLTSDECAALDWSLAYTLNFSGALNPFSYLKIYQQECALTNDIKTHQTLASFLNQAQPEMIFAHSLGCQLVCNFLNNNSIPQSIKKVVFLQADISATSQIGWLLPPLRLVNYFCPWDITLMASSLYYKAPRAGLIGLNTAKVKNVFLPAWKSINPHTSCLQDKQILNIFKQ